MPPLPLARSEAPAAPPAPAPTARESAARDADRIAACLLEALGGLDLTSADGRAGIRTLLSEIDRLSPGAILQQAAAIELRRAGWRGSCRAAARTAGAEAPGWRTPRSSSEAPRAAR